MKCWSPYLSWTPFHFYKLYVSHWLPILQPSYWQFPFSTGDPLKKKVCHHPDISCRRLTSCPEGTMSVTFFFKYILSSLDSVSLISLLVIISRWLVWELTPRRQVLGISFHPFFSQGGSRYVTSHLQSNKIKITTLNRAMLLIQDFTISSWHRA